MAKVKVVRAYALVYGDGIAKVGEIIELNDDVAKRLEEMGVVKVISIEPEEKMERKMKRKGKGKKRK